MISVNVMTDFGAGAGMDGGKRKIGRAVVLCAVVLVVAIALGVGARWWQSRDTKTADPEPAPAQSEVSAAQDATILGDFDKAHKILDEALAKSDLPKEEEVALVAQQGNVYENQQNYDKALEYYLRAAEIDLTIHLAASIARVAEAKGDNELAIEYYKKAIPLIPPDDPTGPSIAELYKSSIVRLGGQP